MTTTDAPLLSGCPVLRFGPRPGGAPPSELQAESQVEEVAAPSGGESLTVLRARDEVRACLNSRQWVMAGVTVAGKVRQHPLTGAERQHPDGGLLNMDPPAHRAFRGRINHLFTPARAAASRSHVSSTAAKLAASLDRRSVVELAAEYADPFIATMVCHSLGLPIEEWPQILAGSVNAFALVEGPDDVRRVDEGWQELYDYYDQVIVSGRAHPAGIIAGILCALKDFDHWQKVHVLANVSNGYPAAMPSLRRVLWELLSQRCAESVRRDERPPSWAARTNQILNTVALFPIALPRRAAADTWLGDTHYAEGTLVLPSLIAAAHDSRHPTAAGIAFGYGPHTCPGAALSRLWLTSAVETFFQHYPDAELVDPEPGWDGGTLATPRHITVRLSPARSEIGRPEDRP